MASQYNSSRRYTALQDRSEKRSLPTGHSPLSDAEILRVAEREQELGLDLHALRKYENCRAVVRQRFEDILRDVGAVDPDLRELTIRTALKDTAGGTTHSQHIFDTRAFKGSHVDRDTHSG